MLFLNSHFLHSGFVGLVGLILFAFPIVRAVSQHQKIGALGSWSPLILLFSTALLTTAAYYLYVITPFISFSIAAMISLLALKQSPLTLSKLPLRFPPGVFYLITALQAIMIMMLMQGRTTDVLVSPWHALPFFFFILFFISLIAMFSLNKKNTQYSLLSTSIQFFIIYSVAAIIYQIGFGFDGFIHRATESWIAQHGFITPKQPYYIGQYSLIVWLHHLTNVSTHVLDVYFVPVVASLSIPAAFSSIMSNKNASRGLVRSTVFFLPLLYFITLNLTTPHNVVLLLFILVTLLLFGNASGKKIPLWIPGLFTAASFATHPLLGVPLLLWFLTYVVYQKTPFKRSIIGAYMLIMTATPAAMFTANNLFGGFGWPTFSNPLHQFGSFFELFARPYWYLQEAGLFWDTIYTVQWAIIPLFLFFAVLGYKKEYRLFLVGSVSFLLAAWLLRSWIVFPNVAVAEQVNYPIRLITTSALFLLPLAASGCISLFRYVHQSIPLSFHKAALGITILSFASILTLAFYFSYPQKNHKARFPGYNITASDFAAIDEIESHSDDKPYIVLANQLVGAAALTKTGFDHYIQTETEEIYYYSVPSGGVLNHYYGQMLYEGQKNDFMQEAMAYAGVNRAYFVVNSYWANFEEIVAGARITADDVLIVNDAALIVFSYDARPADITQ